MIKELFPTPIYWSKFIRDFNKKEIKGYKDIYKNKQNNISNIIGLSNKVLDDTKSFSEIKEFIQVHLNQYTYQVYGMERKQNINITTSWLNLTKPGMAHHHHTHPNSFISGVFYFETIPSDSLIFTAPATHHQKPFIFSNTKGFNYYYDQVTQMVENKTLLLFPSWLRHEVKENKSDVDRISLSFNTYPSGNLLPKDNISNIEIL